MDKYNLSGTIYSMQSDRPFDRELRNLWTKMTEQWLGRGDLLIDECVVHQFSINSIRVLNTAYSYKRQTWAS